MNQTINEENPVELSQLRWHCRRGVKELDVILSNYLNHHYLKSTAEIKQAFRVLLKLEDPILMSLILDYQQLDDAAQNQVLNKMKKPYAK